MLTKEELEYLILVKNLSYEEIGRMEGITGNAIKKRAKNFNIVLPKRRKINPSEWTNFSHKKKKEKICIVCNKKFLPKYNTNITCSTNCLSIYKSIIKRKERPKWDGIEKKNMWTYDHVVKNHGYYYALCPQHPKSLKNGYIYLHRIIVENNLGRLLKDDEIIHHIDFDKTNNSLENLMILTQSEHTRLHNQIRYKKSHER